MVGVLDTTLCDAICQWLGSGRWFSPGTPSSATNKTDRHNTSLVLLKVALKHYNPPTRNWSRTNFNPVAWKKNNMMMLYYFSDVRSDLHRLSTYLRFVVGNRQKLDNKWSVQCQRRQFKHRTNIWFPSDRTSSSHTYHSVEQIPGNRYSFQEMEKSIVPGNKNYLGVWLIDWLIDSFLTPTIAVFQLYRGVN